MLKLALVTALALAAIGATVANAATAPKIAWTGDRALTTTFRLDDGSTGAPGYRRAIWTGTQPLRAVLQVRTTAGKLVETESAIGTTYSRSGAIAFATKTVGVYRVTLTLVSQATAQVETATWVARVTASAGCVPHMANGIYFGCG